jgi:hypothetical protein
MEREREERSEGKTRKEERRGTGLFGSETQLCYLLAV